MSDKYVYALFEVFDTGYRVRSKTLTYPDLVDIYDDYDDCLKALSEYGTVNNDYIYTDDGDEIAYIRKIRVK